MTLSKPSPRMEALLGKDFAFFDCSSRTGFLDVENTASALPEDLPEYQWEAVLIAAKGLQVQGTPTEQDATAQARLWRKSVESTPVISTLSPSLEQSKALRRRAYVVLCMLGHFYMRCNSGITEQNQGPKIPASIAVPWLFIGESLGMKPILCYASEILWNCAFTNADNPETSENHKPDASQLHALETFTGHSSEEAFILGPARVELEGSTVLTSIFETISVHLQSTQPLTTLQNLVTTELNTIQTALVKMRAHLQTLFKECEPSHFYWELRPWIAGTGPDGWNYAINEQESVNLKLNGSTAGAAALLQALDAFLGVDIDGKHMQFRTDMQEYMPRGHRELVQTLQNLKVENAMSEDLRKRLACGGSAAPLRAFVESCEQDSALRKAYNDVVGALKAFRDEHFRIVSLYIINQARKSPPWERQAEKGEGEQKKVTELQGTGGSDLAKLLKGMRDETNKTLL